MWLSPGEYRNPHYRGCLILCFACCQLILSLLCVAAQIAFFSFWDWETNCLVFPAFVGCILGILASCVGLASGIEKTNGLILWYNIIGCLVIITSVVFLGISRIIDELDEFWEVILGEEDAESTTRAAVFWGLFLIPIVNSVLFCVTCCIGMIAICCPPQEVIIESPIMYPPKPVCHPCVQPIPQPVPQPCYQPCPPPVYQPQVTTVTTTREVTYQDHTAVHPAVRLSPCYQKVHVPETKQLVQLNSPAVYQTAAVPSYGLPAIQQPSLVQSYGLPAIQQAPLVYH